MNNVITAARAGKAPRAMVEAPAAIGSRLRAVVRNMQATSDGGAQLYVLCGEVGLCVEAAPAAMAGIEIAVGDRVVLEYRAGDNSLRDAVYRVRKAEAYAAADDALAPVVKRGDVVEFDGADSGEPGDIVMARTPDGRMWMRRLQAIPGGAVLAGVVDDDYPALAEYVIVARAVRRWYRSSSI